jgi:hypothetical protein
MIAITPFETKLEHKTYCEVADVVFEEQAIGFKIHLADQMLGLCQIQFVGNAAYILTLKAINDKITSQLLAKLFLQVAEFLVHISIASIVYPIQDEKDKELADLLGFDRVSDTLYVFDFPEESQGETD